MWITLSSASLSLVFVFESCSAGKFAWRRGDSTLGPLLPLIEVGRPEAGLGDVILEAYSSLAMYPTCSSGVPIASLEVPISSN